MRVTESKRKRDKMPNDPSKRRGDFGDIDTFERKTPTVKARQQRKESKHKNKQEWRQFY